ncbi:hypothetical protein RMSM_04887 [Rhodopirellula maiorica SM1]|uniref:Uncharacterized protein n=1 Tax=Rhodopirellula maiorica SM1 TaxID=1265738 RepID=M5RGD5_9BACT|nr:hypothetical protein [Rhodopirellula maiorica]EMI18196.1 hypothetical protein RMSM_04887 [Rhodopirellula maiorica SM1]
MSFTPNDDRDSSRITSPPSSAASKVRRSGVLKILAGVIFFVAVFAFYATFIPSPRVARGVLSVTADDASDNGYRQVGEVSDQAALSANAVTLEASHNVSTVSTSSSSNGARFFARSLAIYNEGTHLLMERVGLDVFETLRDQERFDTLHYVPAGERLADGGPLPEVFVTLNMKSWKEQGLPGHKTYDGELVVTLGNQYRGSSHHYSTNTTPPQVSFRSQMKIEYHATQTGFETSGARYQAVSRDIAKEIVKRFGKLLDDMAEKHSVPGNIPDAFYPTYVPPPAFDFVEVLKAEKRVDGHLFMSPTEAVWQVTNGGSTQDTIATVIESLRKLGWDVSDNNSQNDYLRATHGNEVVTVFSENDGLGASLVDEQKQPSVFVVYRRSMSEKSFAEAIKQLIQSDASESTLLMFQQRWYRYPEQIGQFFEKHHPTHPDTWLQLARLHKTSDPEAAIQALLKATALQRITAQQSANTSMKKLAEELGMEELPKQISDATITSLGLNKLTSPGELELMLSDDGQAIIYLGERKDRQTWLLLTPAPKRGSGAERPLRIQTFQLGKGVTSRSTQTVGDLTTEQERIYATRAGKNDSLNISSVPAPEPGRYRLKLQRTAN